MQTVYLRIDYTPSPERGGETIDTADKLAATVAKRLWPNVEGDAIARPCFEQSGRGFIERARLTAALRDAMSAWANAPSHDTRDPLEFQADAVTALLGL
jgi:hypothetical protein